ncbi:dienelactone hydrolase family protein [Deinococcus maricopensis]|nr:dienelactone hydrolase family protein [Deinococcus maricopensis]
MRKHASLLAALPVLLAACGTTTSTLTTPAVTPQTLSGAATNPYERGPAPTTALLEAARGPYATASTTVPRSSVSDFGGATIYYPTSTADGTFGGVAISPGYTGTQASVAWLGPRLASHGFVVIVIDTLSRYDYPSSRGDQLRAALRYLTTSSAVRTRVDATRLAVMGHSMGGGGALEAAKDNPALKAAIPLTPWNTDKSWPELTTPTLIFGAQNDSVAPVSSHAIPFYTSLASTLPKAYLELRGASHGAPTSTNTTIAKYAVAWLKRFEDADRRYDPFLCPTPAVSTLLSDARSTCPFN